MEAERRRSGLSAAIASMPVRKPCEERDARNLRCLRSWLSVRTIEAPVSPLLPVEGNFFAQQGRTHAMAKDEEKPQVKDKPTDKGPNPVALLLEWSEENRIRYALSAGHSRRYARCCISRRHARSRRMIQRATLLIASWMVTLLIRR